MRFEGKDEANPDDLLGVMLLIVQKLDAEEKARALDLEHGRHMRGDKDQADKKKKDRTHRRQTREACTEEITEVVFQALRALGIESSCVQVRRRPLEVYGPSD